MRNKPFNIEANKERLQGLHSAIIEAGLLKLKVHKNKGDWLDNPDKRNPSYLIAGLIHEVGELQKAFAKDEEVAYIVDEIGDIFNYLVMIFETTILKDMGEEGEEFDDE